MNKTFQISGWMIVEAETPEAAADQLLDRCLSIELPIVLTKVEEVAEDGTLVPSIPKRASM